MSSKIQAEQLVRKYGSARKALQAVVDGKEDPPVGCMMMLTAMAVLEH